MHAQRVWDAPSGAGEGDARSAFVYNIKLYDCNKFSVYSINERPSVFKIDRPSVSPAKVIRLFQPYIFIVKVSLPVRAFLKYY